MLGHRLILPCLVGLVTEVQASSQAYDEELARNFASLSSATYCNDVKQILNWTCGACKDSKTPLVPGMIKIIDSGLGKATRVVVGKLSKQDGCVVAFRGSDNVFNWVRDFQAWDVTPISYGDCAGCKVHSGFYAIWENVRDEVVNSLIEVGCTPEANSSLYVTGHSLGAAVSQLAMVGLQYNGFSVAKIYNFEAPRVGNKAFADAFSAQFTRKFPIYRITHSQDPVVHLPPKALGYTHVQQEIYYDSTGSYKLCPNEEDTSCADQYWDVPGMVLTHIGDHCGSPLVPNGDICLPVGCDAISELVLV